MVPFLWIANNKNSLIFTKFLFLMTFFILIFDVDVINILILYMK